ncbi:tRNA (adenosine(37)-N6)-threonylcarbamoyltransferase complex dimerization subunit type 1 TsaB [Breznakiella homolactica]|uniref:tRNA (Adenosine(37)-N6)-threonylcarbamoyltransferase complex dimerization subunit type 1 TsaB n=1 Tax=Breznakiella homolactica TaxID=2798577 RepID=A0A7T7XJT0_9SPIR|nr:tRNA (adenosine(37)-N6)-threonylcarbamoyltransferase complex dimerization subunit type 1 TsaB [Breznakiella homolactica]QQO07527.1 tRNA (adenosine(37)-N6)-threonylcarbamoyltransferase complex dimerization subunit type 1 TsaB [Breznakiella homolactica]
MNILALDTATSILSAALSSGDGMRYTEIDAGLRHSELLMEIADDLIKQADLTPKDLSLIACMQGPGSFTGLRIGFSAAKGMALSLGIPFISVPTLDCMAAHCAVWPGAVLPVMDAKKKSFFTALYRGENRVTENLDAEVQTILELLPRDTPVLVTGPDADLFIRAASSFVPEGTLILDPGRRRGNAKELLEKARKLYILNNSGDNLESGPVYIRKSDAELSLRDKQ